ncbi:hypothetical protein HK405_013492, partial [Cladochytrium tenue]
MDVTPLSTNAASTSHSPFVTTFDVVVDGGHPTSVDSAINDAGAVHKVSTTNAPPKHFATLSHIKTVIKSSPQLLELLEPDHVAARNQNSFPFMGSSGPESAKR